MGGRPQIYGYIKIVWKTGFVAPYVMGSLIPFFTSLLLAEVTDSLFNRQLRKMNFRPGVIELQRFPFLFFSICTRNFDVRRECQVSLEKLTTWGFRKCLPICSTRLRPGVIELQRLSFLFSTCTRICTLWGKCQASSKR